MNAEQMRADAALAERGLAPSREKARALIEAGLVACNGAILDKPSRRVSESDTLQVLGQTHPYVSRGGLKLEKALKVFETDVTGLVCVDVGASTGGFTDVLLRSGARLVYAVDVGTGQLHPSLRGNKRVVSMEHVNARALEPSMFPQVPALAVMDVSFISIQLILPALFGVLGEAGRVITLIKPQFEAGRQAVGRHGLVTSAQAHRDVLKSIVAFAPTLGWRVSKLDFSPITGGDGNIEFLAEILPEKLCEADIDDREIDAVVRAAHQKRQL